MWTNAAWPGRSTPANTPSGQELSAYSALVSAVEGNTTFYALPSSDTAARCASSTPDDFCFMFKFPRTVTHDRKLRDVSELVSGFFDVLEPCIPKMHPVAIQLPALFAPADLDVLGRFLGGLPIDVWYAVEVRHLDFFDGDETERSLNDMLFTAGADRIILDSRAVFAGPRVTPKENDVFENKPRVPVRAVATNNTPIVRFIGQTAAAANAEFWAPWVGTVSRWLVDGRSPIVVIHTSDNAAAIEKAREFYDEVWANVPELAPQRDALPSAEPSLFEI